MGQVFALMTREHRLPVVALAIALLRYKADKRESVLEAVSELLGDPRDRSSSMRVALDVLGVYVVVAVVKRMVRLMREARTMSAKRVKDELGSEVVDLLKMVPMARDRIQDEFKKVEADMEKALKNPDRDQLFKLPLKGLKKDEILEMMRNMYNAEKGKWADGWVSGAVYHGGDDHIKMQNQVFSLFNITNPLHPDIWPSVMKFEAEVVSMTANLLNGGTQSVTGTITSGGTESIVLACKAHKEWARKEKGITEPEIIACITAHAAVDKACEILGIRLVHVPMDPETCSVDPRVVHRHITSDTIMIYSSSPQYPHGIIDPIADLSKIAKRANVGLHVDCCLGGFVLPFAKKLGYDVPDFDFRLPGVTSMSCDTHKYGYATKGTSVILYRTPELRRYQYFTYPSWPGGLYVTPTIAGSRPGALSACTWASLVAMGEDGFNDCTRKIMDSALRIRKEAGSIDGIHVMGYPQAMVVAFGSKIFSIYSLADKMEHRGWALNSLQRPASVHICVTLPVTKNVDQFIKDLRECSAECLKEPHKDKDDGQGRVYGMTSALPHGPVKDLLGTYTDVVLKV